MPLIKPKDKKEEPKKEAKKEPKKEKAESYVKRKAVNVGGICHNFPGPNGPFESEYSVEYGRRICEIVATSDLGIAKLCESHPEMPTKTTLYLWLFRHPEFKERYQEAKRTQMDLIAESLDEIAHENFYYIDAEGNKRLDPAFNNDKRLRIDTRKWIASKLLPKVYGDKVLLENTTSENEKLKEELQALRAKLDAQNKKDY